MQPLIRMLVVNFKGTVYIVKRRDWAMMGDDESEKGCAVCDETYS